MEAITQAAATARTPSPNSVVHNDESVLSFDSPYSPTGLYTSLTSWRGVGRRHVAVEAARPDSGPLFLKSVFWKVRDVAAEEDARKKKEDDGGVTKLAIGVEGGFSVDAVDEFVTVEKRYAIVSAADLSFEAPVNAGEGANNDHLPMSVAAAAEAVIAHAGVVRQQAAAAATAWEEEDRKPSRFAENLPWDEEARAAGKKVSPDPSAWVCEESGGKENLWLNLSTGYIGSGRRNWDGSGGTGAALKHYEDTGRRYPLAVKLGTITADGGDVYSYAADEDDMVLDSKLGEHLQRWGINILIQKKTEKTMAELQIDLNGKYEFDALTEKGKDLVKMGGAGYVGLDNLGNSCYMNSVLQLLFALPDMVRKFSGEKGKSLIESAPAESTTDLLTMMAKVGEGLLSERFTRPVPVYDSIEDAEAAASLVAGGEGSRDYDMLSSGDKARPSSVRPHMLKQLIGQGHAEFSSARQQDASEFFQYLLEKLAIAESAGKTRLDGEEATASLFEIGFEDRTQCCQSGMVRYMSRNESLLSLAIPVEAATNKAAVDEYESRAQEAKKQKIESGQATEDEPVRIHVPFTACVEQFGASEVVADYMSSATGLKGTAQKRSRISSFPPYLMVHMRKYYLADDWTPKKLDVSVPVPEELDLEHLRGTGPADGEELLPEKDEGGSANGWGESTAAAVPVLPDQTIVAQVVSMGFGENGAKRAAVATGNTNAEACMEWVFAHMEDPDFNDPFSPAEASGTNDGASSGPEKDSEAIGMLTAMGYSERAAAAALGETGSDLERAADWIMTNGGDDAAIRAAEDKAALAASGGGGGGSGASEPPKLIDGPGKYELVGFASHMGSNTACGHYVAHIKKQGQFVLFNDEKVAISQVPPLDLGFIYLYRRKQ